MATDWTRRSEVALWLLLVALVTAALLGIRVHLDKAHVALVYLALVLFAAARSGLAAGLIMSVATFFAFNFFFLPPYHTLHITRPMDWLILGVYLVTAFVAAALLTRAQREAAQRLALAVQAEQAKTLLEVDRLKDAVLAAVSHDLRTPLSNIKAMAYELADEGDERAHIIGAEADRLNRFVASLLDLSALNSGALRIHPEVHTIEDVVGATLAQVTRVLDGRTIVTHVGEHAVMLGRFDFVYTVRILGNLLENAHKYSPADQSIELGARATRDLIELRVSDRGAGVAESERERIFQPFYRPAGAPPDAASAGLGLAVARRLAEAQGGSLRYEARRGGGSTLVLTVPAARLDDTATPLTTS